jgi:hypothetical protein
MSDGKRVPYFEITDALDGLESLMSFDREHSKTHRVFVRAISMFDGLSVTTEINAVVVVQIAPGFRFRHPVGLRWTIGIPHTRVFLTTDMLERCFAHQRQ